jgi:hydroxymethylglutaryl-CoA reductase
LKPVSGFSKLSKTEKIDFLVDVYLGKSEKLKHQIQGYWHISESEQKIFDEFSENTVTNFYFPYGVVPNMLINGELFCVPMVIEESSVVAACAKAAKFWIGRGGFKSKVVSMTKNGQVHLSWFGVSEKLQAFFNDIKKDIINNVKPLIQNMEARGGGILDLNLLDKTDLEPGYYQIWVDFNTCDAMGANFINSVLEAIATNFKEEVYNAKLFNGKEKDLDVIMAILSNYTPECFVETTVECNIEDLYDKSHGMSASEFALKIKKAVRIAEIDINRATTHNKGIFNGIDAVILATGNDFRAVEAAGHTYASRSGQYRGLTKVNLDQNKFTFSVRVPMSLGTVGGLTALHPLARVSLEMLGRPSAKKLMEIVGAIGVAQNFAALSSLVTSGIQKGHMKMHLMNILNHLEANNFERKITREHFKTQTISFKAVRDFIKNIRNYQ